MKVTIGELSEYALQFSTKIEINEVNKIPFMKIYVTGYGNINRAFVYVVQVDENKYAVCDVPDEYNGNRYIPTGNISNPFILEKQLAGQWFSDKKPNDETFPVVNKEGFRDYFFGVLHSYGLLRFNPKDFNTTIYDMGFKSDKVKRVLSRAFKDHHCPNKSMAELIDIFNHHNATFSLDSLREREIGCIVAKLKDLGLEATTNGDVITNIKYMYKRSDTHGKISSADSTGLL